MQSVKTKTLEQSLTVAIFLGGITLGVLTFLFQAQIPTEKVLSLEPKDYKSFLISMTGLASTLLIISIFGMKVSIVRGTDKHAWFSWSALLSYEGGYILLLVLLPFLVMPFFQTAAFLIVGIEIMWGIILTIDKLKK
jgi:hypothetical protein